MIKIQHTQGTKVRVQKCFRYWNSSQVGLNTRMFVLRRKYSVCYLFQRTIFTKTYQTINICQVCFVQNFLHPEVRKKLKQISTTPHQVYIQIKLYLKLQEPFRKGKPIYKCQFPNFLKFGFRYKNSQIQAVDTFQQQQKSI